MNIITLIGLAILPVISTFTGGYVVYRWKRDLHPWLSLSGGLLLGVAFLDLLPEAFAHSNGLAPVTIGALALGGILVFHLIDNLFGAHHHEHGHPEPEEACENERHQHAATWIRAGGIMFHTFLDGVAIGAGFATNAQLGILILTAVILHDFSDGMSTVTILKGIKRHDRDVLRMLMLNAVAPFIGVFVGFKLALSEQMIAVFLSIFAGLFITIALSELLPHAHAVKTRRSGFLLTILGIACVIILRSLGHA